MWPDDPPESARHALQVYLSSLRKAIGPDRIVTEPAGYRIVVAEDELDALSFRRHLRDGALTAALALWRGPIESTDPAAAELEALRVTAQEDHFDAEPDIPALERHTREHPHRERGHRQLMLALYRAGRQADALAAYQTARRALDELGLEPGEELRKLELAILRRDPKLDARLPAPVTPLIGRRREVEEIRRAAARGAAGDARRTRRRGQDADRAGGGAGVPRGVRRSRAAARPRARRRPDRGGARRRRAAGARQLRAPRRGGSGRHRSAARHARPALPGDEPARAAALRRAPVRGRAARAVGRGGAAVRGPRPRRRRPDRAGRGRRGRSANRSTGCRWRSNSSRPEPRRATCRRASRRWRERSRGASTCSTIACEPASTRWPSSPAAGTPTAASAVADADRPRPATRSPPTA